jgi:hypothetical protein
MNRIRRAALAVACALALGACATATKSNVSWENPEAKPLSVKPGAKVLALVLIANDGMRRMSEDSLAGEISARGLQGVPAYTVLPTDLPKDKDQAKAAVVKAGAVGAVVMRVLAKESVGSAQLSKTVTYTATWDSASGWSTPYNPSDMRSDTVVVVETLVYDLGQDKLVWAGQTQSTSPKKVDGLIREIAATTAAQLRQQGVSR